VAPFLLILALAGWIVIGESASRPDPEQELYGENRRRDSDVYFNGIQLGSMHRPDGPVRRVAWYEGEAIGGLLDGWELRIVFEYDRAGRVTRIEHWETGAPLLFEALLRDSAGQILEVTRERDPGTWRPHVEGQAESVPERVSQELWTYDAAGRPLQGILSRGEVFEGEILYVYDDAARHVSKERIDQYGDCASLAEADLDDQGRIVHLVLVRGADAGTFRWAYDPRGLPVFQSFDLESGGGSRWFLEYDELGRVTRSCWTPSDGDWSRRDFVYSDEGRLAGSCETRSPTSLRHSTVAIEVLQQNEAPLYTEYVNDDGQITTERHAYKTDERGNWIVRYLPDTGAPEIKRTIEYYE
jgi:hypothetical protein